MPPGAKSTVPASTHVATMAGRNSKRELPRRTSKIDATGARGLRVLLVGNQRIGRDRQRLVEQEQREQVAGEGDSDGAAERDGEADVEYRLAWLVVGPHVADRIERVHDPQRRRHESEQQAERLDLQGERDAWQHLDDRHLRPRARQHRCEQAPNDGAKPAGGNQRHGLAQVGAPAKKRDDDGARERNEQREQGQPLAAHRIPPSRLADALAAIPAVHSVSKPK